MNTVYFHVGIASTGRVCSIEHVFLQAVISRVYVKTGRELEYNSGVESRSDEFDEG